MDPPENAIETSASTIWIDDEIVHIRSKGVASTPQSIAEAVGAIRKLIVGTPRPTLFDARQWPQPNPEVWVSTIADLQSTTTTLAMLIDSDSPIMLGEYPTTIDRLLIPFQTFSDEAEAVAFLKRESNDA